MAEPVKKVKKPRKIRVPLKEREYFTENLALLLQAAVPVGDAFESLKVGIKSRAFKKALTAMHQDIEAGYTISDALERSGVASSQTLALVRMGEVSGNLTENLQIAAQQEEKHHQFVSKVRSAFIYPAFVLTLTVVIGLSVAWFLLPRLADTFSQLKVALPPISQALISFGIFLRDHGIIAVPVAAFTILLIIYILFAAPGTKNIGKTLLLHTPGVGRLIKEVELAQFGYLFGTLMDAGFPVTQALRLMATSSTTPQYQKLYRHLADSVDDGYTFKDSFNQYKKSDKLIPVAVQQMIVAGERSGSLPTVLKTVGRTYEQKSDTTTQNLETIVEPILLVIVAGGVMLVAVAVIVPIYSLIGGLNQ